MDEYGKVRKLRRITLGGLEQLPEFTGDYNDYSCIKKITCYVGIRKDVIKIERLNISYKTKRYMEVGSINSFLANLDSLMEERGLYLTHCVRGKTFFLGRCMITGFLYNLKDKKVVSENP